jgi:hypothetical protein
MRGPYDIRREVVVKLVEALRGLRRKPLDADHLIADFGLQSTLTKRTISVLYRKLLSSESPRTRLLFDIWRRLFTQATGYRPEELEELSKLAGDLGLSGKVNYDALIFSIHTYYAFLMKLMAAEIVYLYGGGKFYRSYIAELDDAFSREGLRGSGRLWPSLRAVASSGGCSASRTSSRGIISHGIWTSWTVNSQRRLQRFPGGSLIMR